MPVNIAEPVAKKAGKERKEFLTIKPLYVHAEKDPIQTAVDKGKPEKGGNFNIENPIKDIQEIAKLNTVDNDKKQEKQEKQEKNSLKSKVFDIETSSGKPISEAVVKKQYLNKHAKIYKLNNDGTNTVINMDRDSAGNLFYKKFAITYEDKKWQGKLDDIDLEANTQIDLISKIDLALGEEVN